MAPHYTRQYKSTPFSLFPYSSSLTEIPKFQNSNPPPWLHHQLKFPSFVFHLLDWNYDSIHWSFISYFQFSHSNRIFSMFVCVWIARKWKKIKGNYILCFGLLLILFYFLSSLVFVHDVAFLLIEMRSCQFLILLDNPGKLKICQ